MRTVIAIYLLTIVAGLGLWQQDVANVVMEAGKPNVTNGFVSMGAMKAAHLGLGVAGTAVVIIAVLGIVWAIRGRRHGPDP